MITQVLGARTITIEDVQSGGASVDARVAKLPIIGAVKSNGKVDSTWSGAKLYLAERVESFKVTYRVAPSCGELPVGTGQTCDLDACSVKIDGASAGEDYGATLSCQGGQSYPIVAKLGAWVGQATGPGVSYSLRCKRSAKAGLFACDFGRWNVLPQ